MLKTMIELQADSMLHGALLLALAWKDQTPGGLQKAFANQYTPLVHRVNKATPPEPDLSKAITDAYRLIVAQLSKP